MDKKALLTYLKQRRDSLQNLVDRDFGGQISFNYMGALRELKYLIVFIEELNRFDGDPVGESKPLVNWNEKQLGTLMAYMQAGLEDRELVRTIAKRNNFKILGDINEELRLFFALRNLKEELYDK
jgi:alpha/beta superfamily hydrolase